MDYTYKVNIHGHGFEIGKDISENELETLQAEYMAMYQAFADMSNSVLEQINATWKKYEEAVELSNLVGGEDRKVIADELRTVMGIKEADDYNDWVEKWYMQIAEAIDINAEMAKFRMRSNIFRDGDIPIYGAKFVDHPEWTMDFTLEPV